jgi:hypothetical protein
MHSMMKNRGVPARMAMSALLWGACASPAFADPVCLLSLGTSLVRVNADGNGGVEQFSIQPITLVAMTEVPPGVQMSGAGPGDIIAVTSNTPNTLYKILNAKSGTPTLVQIGTLAANTSSVGFANGQLFTIDSGGLVQRFDPTTYTQIGASIDVTSTVTNLGGLTFDGNQTWYALSSAPNALYRFPMPITTNSLTLVGTTALDIGACGIEMFEGQVWMGTKIGANLIIGPWNTQTGQFTTRWQIPTAFSGNTGFVTFSGSFVSCDSLDFNNDTITPDSADLDDFIAVLSGGPSACSTFPTPGCNDLDFNNDAIFPDSADLDSFISRLAGGAC